MPHGPHIRIDKHLEDGHGDIVMNALLDPTAAMKIIHGLGLNGVSGIVEREDRRGYSLTLSFGHTEAARLDSDVHLLANALQTGLDIDDIEDKSAASIDKIDEIEYATTNDLKTKKDKSMAAAEIPHELGVFALSGEKVPFGAHPLTPEQRGKLLATRQGLAEFRDAWDATSRQYERTADAFYPPEVPKQIGHLTMINGGQVEAPPAERRAA